MLATLGSPSLAAKTLRSGIRGKAVAFNTAPLPPEAMAGNDVLQSGDPMPDVVIIIYRFSNKEKREFARAKTNARGRFELRCAPGQYSVTAKPREPNNGYFNDEVKVKVQRNKFAYVQVGFDCGW